MPTVPRLLVLGFGGLLLGTYLYPFFHVVDVVGGVQWFVLSVGSALVAATLFARWGTPRRGLLVGSTLAVGGVVAYALSAPSILDDLLTIDFVLRWLSYLTGLTVLQFERADVWAIAVAPGPAFLSWFLLLSRRYGASALVGGLMLAFFTSTGDAGATATLVGMTSLLGVLGVGQVERNPGALGDVLRLGFVLALAAVVARTVQVVPGSEAGSTGSGVNGSDGSGESSISGDLDNAGEEAHIHESISLSPTVLFSVRADESATWRVAAYDRYTGSDWVRTGEPVPYDGTLDPPPGDSTRLVQIVDVRRSVRTIPAAWKPLAVEGVDGDDVNVTDLTGVVPTRALEPSERLRVTSAVPVVDTDDLRQAGDEYPQSVLERYRQLPESTPGRVRRLAEQIAGGESTAYDAAVAIQRWLGQEKFYSTSVQRPSGDVADAFLFSIERGYCVYFATAMAVLLRSIGVPARFTLGYTTGQAVARDRWVVRGFDSHAWVEVYFPGRGWVSFDPTPSTPRRFERISVLEEARDSARSDVDAAGSESVDAQFVDTNVNSVGMNASVIDDETAPENLNSTVFGDRPGERAASVAQASAANATESGSQDRDLGPVEDWVTGRDRIALLAGAAGATIGLHWVGAFDRGLRAARLRWQRPTDSPRRDVVRAYERFELLLDRHYRGRSDGETRRRHLAAAGFRDVGGARRLIDLYERAAYGDGVTRSEADEAIRIVDEFVESRT